LSRLQIRPRVDVGRVEYGGGDDEPPPPAPPSSTAPFVADELASTARQTRAARRRTLTSLAILTVVAVGAVIAGVAADSAAFWAGASVVFYTALAAVIAFAANELGVVAKTASLLRAALKSEAPVDAESESGEEVTHADVPSNSANVSKLRVSSLQPSTHIA
jgi:hypothetical protein